MDTEQNPNEGHIGPALRGVRTGARMSLQDLADAAGISRNHLWSVETGKRNLAPDRLRQVLQAVANRLHGSDAA